MTDEGINQLHLDARIAELQPLRRTPAGVPIAACGLAHESKQLEAGLSRDVSVELQAVAVGELASVLASASPGMRIRVAGFLAAKSLRSRSPVLHLSKIEFLEGNENGFQQEVCKEKG
ncbi:primosomal replication protein N [Aromatoleum evansii]|uniref:Replication restart protein PriB n=1 Tax=Aromatoleum evansii TaxID=59406 RepID=A0ABZ1AMF1_AROEV|nr:primosomal replication protein N [Aromatoleum evansii]WRL47041.1 primosomal replication protein N [Aromatoleum evansii]